MSNLKNTLIIGGSTNPERYAYRAAKILAAYRHPVFAISNKKGELDAVVFQTQYDPQLFPTIDTVTLYVGPKNQDQLFDFLKDLKPKRVIFNPGTENPKLSAHLDQHQIEWEEACTLVLLNTGQY